MQSQQYANGEKEYRAAINSLTTTPFNIKNLDLTLKFYQLSITKGFKTRADLVADFGQAFEGIQQAAESGNPQAKRLMALMIVRKLGCIFLGSDDDQNIVTVLVANSTVADKLVPFEKTESIMALASELLNKPGIVVELYKLAAKTDPCAKLMLADLLSRQPRNEADSQTAYQLFKEAAQAGIPMAQFRMAHLAAIGQPNTTEVKAEEDKMVETNPDAAKLVRELNELVTSKNPDNRSLYVPDEKLATNDFGLKEAMDLYAGRSLLPEPLNDFLRRSYAIGTAAETPAAVLVQSMLAPNLKTSFALLQKAALLGSVHAQRHFALLILRVNGIIPDEKPVVTVVALAGNPEIQAELKKSYANEISVAIAKNILAGLSDREAHHAAAYAKFCAARLLHTKTDRSTEESAQVTKLLVGLVNSPGNILLQLTKALTHGIVLPLNKEAAFVALLGAAKQKNLLAQFMLTYLKEKVYTPDVIFQKDPVIDEDLYKSMMDCADLLLQDQNVVERLKVINQRSDLEPNENKATDDVFLAPREKEFTEAAAVFSNPNSTTVARLTARSKLKTAAEQKYPPAQAMLASHIMEAKPSADNQIAAYSLFKQAIGEQESIYVIAFMMLQKINKSFPVKESAQQTAARKLLKNPTVEADFTGTLFNADEIYKVADSLSILTENKSMVHELMQYAANAVPPSITAQTDLGLGYMDEDRPFEVFDEAKGYALIQKARQSGDAHAILISNILELSGLVFFMEVNSCFQTESVAWLSAFLKITRSMPQEMEMKEADSASESEKFVRAVNYFLKPSAALAPLTQTLLSQARNLPPFDFLRGLSQIEKDPGLAFKAMKLAAENGNYHAQYLFANLILAASVKPLAYPVLEEDKAARNQFVLPLLDNNTVLEELRKNFSSPACYKFAMDLVQQHQLQRRDKFIDNAAWKRASLDGSVFMALNANPSSEESARLQSSLVWIINGPDYDLQLQLAMLIFDGDYLPKNGLLAYSLLAQICTHKHIPTLYVIACLMEKMFKAPLTPQLSLLHEDPAYQRERDFVNRLLRDKPVITKFQKGYAKLQSQQADLKVPGQTEHEIVKKKLGKELSPSERKRTIDLLKKAAINLKYFPAQTTLAELSAYGVGMPVDIGYAYLLLKQAARNGCPEAMSVLRALRERIENPSAPRIDNPLQDLALELMRDKSVLVDFIKEFGAEAEFSQLIQANALARIKALGVAINSTPITIGNSDEQGPAEEKNKESFTVLESPQATPQQKFQFAFAYCDSLPEKAYQLIKEAAANDFAEAKKVLAIMAEQFEFALDEQIDLAHVGILLPGIEISRQHVKNASDKVQSIAEALLSRLTILNIVSIEKLFLPKEHSRPAEVKERPGSTEFDLAMKILTGAIQSKKKIAEAQASLMLAVQKGHKEAKYQLALLLVNDKDENLLTVFNLIIEAALVKVPAAIALRNALLNHAPKREGGSSAGDAKSSIENASLSPEQEAVIQKLLANSHVLGLLQRHTLPMLEKNAPSYGSAVIVKNLPERLAHLRAKYQTDDKQEQIILAENERIKSMQSQSVVDAKGEKAYAAAKNSLSKKPFDLKNLSIGIMLFERSIEENYKTMADLAAEVGSVVEMAAQEKNEDALRLMDLLFLRKFNNAFIGNGDEQNIVALLMWNEAIVRTAETSAVPVIACMMLEKMGKPSPLESREKDIAKKLLQVPAIAEDRTLLNPDKVYEIADKLNSIAPGSNAVKELLDYAASDAKASPRAQVDLGLAYLNEAHPFKKLNQDEGHELIRKARQSGDVNAVLISHLLELTGIVSCARLLVFLKTTWGCAWAERFDKVAKSLPQEMEMKADHAASASDRLNRSINYFLKPSDALAPVMTSLVEYLKEDMPLFGLLKGLGEVEKNLRDAFGYIKQAAYNGNFHAQYLFAVLILEANNQTYSVQAENDKLCDQFISPLIKNDEIYDWLRKNYSGAACYKFATDIVNRYHQQQHNKFINNAAWKKALADGPVLMGLNANPSKADVDQLQSTLIAIVNGEDYKLQLQLAILIFEGRFLSKNVLLAYSLLNQTIAHKYQPALYVLAFLMKEAYNMPIHSKLANLQSDPAFQPERDFAKGLLANLLVMSLFRKSYEKMKKIPKASGQIKYEAAVKVLDKKQFSESGLQSALNNLMAAARDKYPAAQTRLAGYHAHGMYVKQDMLKAYSLLKEAARNGSIEARHTLFSLLERIKKVPLLKDKQEADILAEKLMKYDQVVDQFTKEFTGANEAELSKLDAENTAALIKRNIVGGSDVVASDEQLLTHILAETANTEDDPDIDDLAATPQQKFQLALTYCHALPVKAYELILEAATDGFAEAKNVLQRMSARSAAAFDEHTNAACLALISPQSHYMKTLIDDPSDNVGTIAEALLSKIEVLNAFNIRAQFVSQNARPAEVKEKSGPTEFDRAMLILASTLPSKERIAEAETLLMQAVQKGHKEAKYQLALLLANGNDENLLTVFNLIIEAASVKVPDAVALRKALQNRAPKREGGPSAGDAKSSVENASLKPEQEAVIQKLLANAQVLGLLQRHDLSMLEKNAASRGSVVIAKKLPARLAYLHEQHQKVVEEAAKLANNPISVLKFVLNNVYQGKSAASDAIAEELKKVAGSVKPLEHTAEFWDLLSEAQMRGKGQELLSQLRELTLDEILLGEMAKEKELHYMLRRITDDQGLEDKQEQKRSTQPVARSVVWQNSRPKMPLAWIEENRVKNAEFLAHAEQEKRAQAILDISMKPKDPLLALKVLFDQVYVGTNTPRPTVLAAQALDSSLRAQAMWLRNFKYTPEFWQLICDGVMGGKGQEFVKRLRELNYCKPLFDIDSPLELDYLEYRAGEYDAQFEKVDRAETAMLWAREFRKEENEIGEAEFDTQFANADHDTNEVFFAILTQMKLSNYAVHLSKSGQQKDIVKLDKMIDKILNQFNFPQIRSKEFYEQIEDELHGKLYFKNREESADVALVSKLSLT